MDWFRILIDLKRQGFSMESISDEVDIPKSTLQGYKAGAEPRHEDGERLLAFWMRATGNSRETAQIVEPYSSAQLATE